LPSAVAEMLTAEWKDQGVFMTSLWHLSTQ